MTTTPTPSISCPVCGTDNPSTRQFCRKCASDLHAPPPPPGGVVVPEPASIPMRPILIGGGIALVVALLAIGLFVVLTGKPAPSASPTAGPTAGPTVTPLVTPTPEPPTAPPATTAPTAAPTEVPPPSIVSFEGPVSVNCGDPNFPSTIHLTWRVANAEGTTLAIDGTGIYQRYPGVLGQDDVPFSCGGESHTYLLTTTGGNGPAASSQLVIGPT